MLLNQWESLKVRFRPDGTKEIEPSLAEWLNAGRDDIRRELDQLAFEAHRDQAELVGTADIRQERLVAALLKLRPKDRTSKPKSAAGGIPARPGRPAGRARRRPLSVPASHVSGVSGGLPPDRRRFPDKLAASCAPIRTAGAR